MPPTRLPTPPPSSEPTDSHRPRRGAATGAPPTRPDGLRMSLLPGPLPGGKTMQRLQSVVSQGGARRPMLRLRRSPHPERPHRLRPQLQGGDSHLILSNPFREISTGLYKTSVAQWIDHRQPTTHQVVRVRGLVAGCVLG